MNRKTKMLNIEIARISKNELLERLDSGVLVTPNVDHMVTLQKDREFYDIYHKAEWVVCDSRILYLCSKLTIYRLYQSVLSAHE